MLELRNLTKGYAEDRKVLANLSYTLNAGEYVAIMGESGVGKSTLLNLIAGLDSPDSGEIRINGLPFHPCMMMPRRYCGANSLVLSFRPSTCCLI